MGDNFFHAKRCDTSYTSIYQKSCLVLAFSFINFKKQLKQDYPLILKNHICQNECIFKNKKFSGNYYPRRRLHGQLKEWILISINKWLILSFID